MSFKGKVKKSSSNSRFIPTSSNLQTKSRLRNDSPAQFSARKSSTPNVQAREKLTKYGHNLSNIALSYNQPSIDSKLTIGQPRDKSEQEADKVAAQLVDQIKSPSQTAHKQENSSKAHA